MMSRYSDEEIVKAFKTYIKKVVRNAAIDYARIIKSAKYREVLFSELVDRKVSLSNYGSGTFFVDEILFQIQNSDAENSERLKKILSSLKEKDKTIFKLLVKKKNNREIAEILNVNEKTIRNRKSAMKKFILEGLRKNYENFN